MGITPQWRAARTASSVLIAVLPLCICLWALLPIPRPQCARQAAGLTCKSCGLTRSISAFFTHGPSASRAAHPAGIFFLAFTALGLVTRPVLYRVHAPLWIALDFLAFLGGWIGTCVYFFGLP